MHWWPQLIEAHERRYFLQVSSRPKISKGQSHLPRPLEVPACRVPDVLVLKSTDEDFGLPLLISESFQPLVPIFIYYFLNQVLQDAFMRIGNRLCISGAGLAAKHTSI